MASTAPSTRRNVSEEDILRSQLYRLLGRLLARAPDNDTLAMVRNLQGDDTKIGKAFQSLAAQAEKFNHDTIKREYADLFIGLGRGELVPYGSYYLTGFLNEKPLAKLRNSMRELGFERADNVKEPEDHIASLMEMMAALIDGELHAPLSTAGQYSFFENHIGNWAEHFFKDLETAESAQFYRPLGIIGQCFMEIEKAAFKMANNTPGDAT